MIDRVQQTLEGLAPELEDYAKRKIFSEKEIARIVETRRRFETRLQRSERRLEDFLQYAESERKLESLRNRRIKKSNVPCAPTDSLLTRNILGIYGSALRHFREPVVIRDFAEYCIKRHCHDEMRAVFAERCRCSAGDVDLWVFCAQKLWEIGDMAGARSLFLNAVSVNTGPRLLTEFFRLEVLYAAKAAAVSAELGVPPSERDAVESGDVALAVFQSLAPGASEDVLAECLEIASAVDGLPARVSSLYDAARQSP